MVDLDFIRDRLLKEVLSGDYPPETRSVLLYQAGQILEMQGQESAEAMRQYLLSLKVDDDFQLPVLAAGSILLGTSSYQRLTRLYQVAMEKASGRTAGMLALFIAEHLGRAPVEGLERLELLERLGDSEPDRLLSLVLREWEHLAAGDAPARADVVASWREASAQPLVTAQLGLEMARSLVEEGQAERAWQVLEEVAEAGVDVFPVFTEIVRLGMASGDRLRTVRTVLAEAGRLIASESSGADAVSNRFLVASPASGAEAAALLASLGWQLAGGAPEVLRDPVVMQRMDEVLAGLDREAVHGSGLDAALVEHLLASGRTDELESFLLASHADTPVDRAWNLWCRARAALSTGRFEDVKGLFAQIRELGFDSRVLDALESLGGGTGAGREGDGADPLNALIGLEAQWTSGVDPGALTRLLAERDDLDGGVADLAYAVARVGGDSFLRQKALEALSAGTPARVDLALVDLVRLHGYERPNSAALGAVMGRIAGEPRAAHMLATLLGVRRLVGEGRGEDVEPALRMLVSHLRGSAMDDPAVRGQVAFVLGKPPGVDSEPPGSYGPFEVHALVRAGGDAATAPGAARWLARAIAEESPGLDREVAGAVSTLVLGMAPAGEDASRLAALVLDPSFGLDAATRLHLAMRLGDHPRILTILEELSEELEPGVARAALRLTVGLRRLFEDGDVDAAIHALGSAIADDPENTEALFALAFLGPAVDRWREAASAIDALLAGGTGDHPYEVAWKRVRMLLCLLVDGDPDRASKIAADVLSARGGDPAGLVVQMAAARAGGDLGEYAAALNRLALWFGDPHVKGLLAHHQLLVGMMDPSLLPEQEMEDRLPPPDPVNLPSSIATAVLNGPVDLTDAGVAAAREELRALPASGHKSRALVELAELVEASGQSTLALSTYIDALEADPREPAAIEGAMRLAPVLEDDAALARATEARAAFVTDTRRKLRLFLKAAELYAQDKDTWERAAACYQQAADLDPSDPRSFTGLVRAMELRGDVSGVIDLIERRVASTMEPEEIEVLQLKLADLRRQIRDFDGALLALDDLLIVQPRKVTAWRMKLDLLVQLERYGEALDAADQLLEYAEDRQSRMAVLHKCISISLARIKDLKRGLAYCLRLISEGEADDNLVSKTMRLALRLEAWDEAAALQEELARKADSTEKRHALLLKKAEIHLRYSKNTVEAAEVYRRILSENPVSWEALMRWNAARGSEGLSRDEVKPYVDQVHSLLEADPLRLDAIAFLVKSYRLLREATAARYYDAVHSLIGGGEDGRPQAPRTSMAPVVPQIPQGALPEDEVAELLGVHGPGSFVASALANLSDGGAIPVLEADGMLPPARGFAPLEAMSPVARQILAWGESLGVGGLVLGTAPDVEGGVRLEGGAIVLESMLAHPAPDAVLFRAGMLLGGLALRAPVLLMLERTVLIELVKAGFMAAGVDTWLAPAEGTWELAERLRNSVTSGCLGRLASLAEVAPSADEAAIVEGLRQLGHGTMRAGLLVSASVHGMLAFDRQTDELPGGVAEFFEVEAHLREGLRFALSSRFVRLRRLLGLDQ